MQKDMINKYETESELRITPILFSNYFKVKDVQAFKALDGESWMDAGNGYVKCFAENVSNDNARYFETVQGLLADGETAFYQHVDCDDYDDIILEACIITKDRILVTSLEEAAKFLFEATKEEIRKPTALGFSEQAYKKNN